MNWLEQLLLVPEDTKIIWAFLLAGTQDDHSAQSLLSEEQWNRADQIYQVLLKSLDSE